jgi:thiamine pyrophosphokinase
MRALVVGAAPWPGAPPAFYADLARTHDLIVAADAAAEWLQAIGIVPDLAVGDFDSAFEGAPERLVSAGVALRMVPSDKDSTDLELAVAEARTAGATSLTITAAFSLRLDHTLAALGLLARTADLSSEAREPGFTAWALDGGSRHSVELPLEAGALVSIVALLGPAHGVTLTGMAYPLDDAEVPAASGLGISNSVVSTPAGVAVASGSLLVMTPHDPRA